jgi:hypothetical protein
MTDLAKPALGQTVVDPAFGTTIRRITDVGTTGGVITTLYTTMPAWNADESYLMLVRAGDGKQLLYDGKTYRYLRDLDINPPDIEQVYWHGTDPKTFFYVDNAPGAGKAQLVRYDVTVDPSAAKTVVKTFTECTGTVSSGDDPVYGAWSTGVFSFLCAGRPGGAGDTVLLYDAGKNTVLVQSPAVPPVDQSAPKPPRVGPSGSLTLWNANVTDLALKTLRTIDIRNPDEHTNNGTRVDGHDFFASVVFDPPTTAPPGSDNDYVGTLVTYDLSSASSVIKPDIVIGPKTGYPYPNDSHVSTMTLRNRGWVLVSTNDADSPPDGKDLLDLELVYADTNTGRVCRVAHHRSWGKQNTGIGYFAEAHGVPSPTGTRIVFASDWGGGTSVDTYVVELPGYAH